ncbi:MAG: type I 3-dehydroquinate dehydratase [Candidatus Ratteibacteria bacterium]
MKGLIKHNQIAVVLTGGEPEKVLKKIQNFTGWIELRIDCFIRKFSENDVCKWSEQIREKTQAKIIATVRWYKESQDPDFIIPDNKRISLYESIADYADYFDVEIKSKIAPDVLSLAKKKGKKVILSYHDFKRFSSLKLLIKLKKEAQNSGADMIKVAVRAETEKQLLQLCQFVLLAKKSLPVIAIPMGTQVIERLTPLAFGSVFTYFGLVEKTAPGQPVLSDLLPGLDK